MIEKGECGYMNNINKIDLNSEAMSIEEKVVKQLNTKHMLLTTAESCTGGMVASSIVNVSGASNVFHQGYITYCDEAKNSILNVPAEILDEYKAVSPQVACKMALGALSIAAADIAVSVTGVAGPSTEDGKPVGLVYIGVASNKDSAYTDRFDTDTQISDITGYAEAYKYSRNREVLYKADNSNIIVSENVFEGDRSTIRDKACKKALDMVYAYVKEINS